MNEMLLKVKIFEQKGQGLLSVFNEKLLKPSKTFKYDDINMSISEVNYEIRLINNLIKENNENFRNHTEKFNRLKIDLMGVLKLKVKPHINSKIKKIEGLMKTKEELIKKSWVYLVRLKILNLT